MHIIVGVLLSGSWFCYPETKSELASCTDMLYRFAMLLLYTSCTDAILICYTETASAVGSGESGALTPEYLGSIYDSIEARPIEMLLQAAGQQVHRQHKQQHA